MEACLILNQLLPAGHDPIVALAIPFTYIAGFEPTIWCNGLRGRSRIVQVPLR